MSIPTWQTTDPEFRSRFSALRRKLSFEEGLRAVGAGREPPLDVVRRIIQDVRARGDAALIELTERLDRCRLTPDRFLVSPAEISAAVERCPADLLGSLKLAAGRIRRFQEATLIHDPAPVRDGGRVLGLRYRPVESAAICVPGGKASYASSLLMAGVPAKVAGVRRLVMITPPRPDGTVSDDRLVAASLVGFDEIYRIGGAQAVAAVAYGTQTIRPVDFVAGPGNIYVTLAKREVFGQVGIESLPGPSEVVILADETARPDWVAADLIAQAEHNPGSSVLLTDSAKLAGAVRQAVEARLADLPRRDVTAECLTNYSAIVLARSLDECISLADELAGEHVEVMTRDPEAVADRVRQGGAVFVGAWAPVPVGDYVAGPSHVLPTGGTARFSSGLSANDFLKRSSLIAYDADALSEDAPHVARLARAEGLDGHALAVEARLVEQKRRPPSPPRT